MKKLYYRYIGRRTVYFEYYIDNVKIDLPNKMFIGCCDNFLNCAIKECLKTNNIKDTDIEVCPATRKTSIKLWVLFDYFKEGVYLEYYVNDILIEQTLLDFTHSLDTALKALRKAYSLQRIHIDVYHIGAKDFLLRKFSETHD